LMLPPELLRVRRRSGRINLQLARDEALSLAKTLILVYEEHIGLTRGELREALGSCEELGFDYKLVRGLSVVLEERCDFLSRASVDPVKARKAVFEEAGGRVVATEEERNRVLSTVAFRLGVSVHELDRSLYADLDDEQELAEFFVIEPTDLLKGYNLASTVTLLAHAGHVELTYRGRDEGLVENGEKLGSCDVSASGSLSKMVVEWKPTNLIAYKAVNLESLLDRILSHSWWRLTAQVWFPSKAKKPYVFEATHEDAGEVMGSLPIVERRVSDVPIVPEPLPGIRGEIVDVAEEALRLGVTEAEVMRRLEGRGLVDIGGVLISRGKLDEVEEALRDARDMRLGALIAVLRRVGARNPVSLLEAMGYSIDWAPDRKQSVVYRLRKKAV
jgi:hypothetical protein